VLLTPGSFGREGHDEPWHVSRWSWFWWKCQPTETPRRQSGMNAYRWLAWMTWRVILATRLAATCAVMP